MIKWLNISRFLYEYEDERITKYQPQPVSGTALYRLSADLSERRCVLKYTKNAQKNIKKTKKVQSGNTKLQALTSIIAIFYPEKSEKSDLTLCNLQSKPLETAIQSSTPRMQRRLRHWGGIIPYIMKRDLSNHRRGRACSAFDYRRTSNLPK